MDTQGIEKGLEKDSNPVVQSDRVSGVTTDSSAKIIRQSKPVYSGVWIVSHSSYSFHLVLLLLLLYIGVAFLMCWDWL